MAGEMWQWWPSMKAALGLSKMASASLAWQWRHQPI